MYEAVLPYPNIDPVLVHLGPFAIRWYAIAYIAGLLLGWWLLARTMQESRLWKNPPFNGKAPATADDIGDFVVWATLGVILGGRLGWVLFYGTILCSVTPGGSFCGNLPGSAGLPADFFYHPIRIISVWDGGMSFHGGLIGVVVAVWLFCRKRKLHLVRFADALCTVVPIGLFFGRIANFINGELWGKVTNVPWAMVFCTPHVMQTYHGYCPAGTAPRHPSQLYEAGLEGLILFAIMQMGLRVFRWHERPGLLVAVFLVGYGLARVFVEFFREPDAAFLGPISMGQALSSIMFIGAAIFFWYAFRRTTVAARA